MVDCSSVGDEKRDLMAMVVEIRNMARPKLYQGGFHTTYMLVLVLGRQLLFLSDSKLGHGGCHT